MRILAGFYKGKAFQMPKGIRPTQDKVRKALFDILGDLEGLTFLELFAGSGAVGLEAASRGAREVVCVEQDRLSLITANIASVGARACQALPLAVEAAIHRLHRQGRAFDIVFLDPPYEKAPATPNPIGRVAPCLIGRQVRHSRGGVPPSAAKKTLHTLGTYDIVAPDGFVIVQHFKKDALPDALGVLRLLRRSRYGDTVLSFYRKGE